MAREWADPYAYPGTGVLMNKPGIRDEKVLAVFEYEQTYARANELAQGPAAPVKFDFNHLKSIHAHLFKDVYEWAGQPRTVNISKGGTSFERIQNIESAGERFGNQLQEQNNLRGLDKRQFVEKISSLYADLNTLHPFREGNGRATREFLGQLARGAGYELDQSRIDNAKNQWNQAAARCVHGDLGPIKEIFSHAIRHSQAVAFETLPRAEALQRHPELQRTFDALDDFQKTLSARYPDNQKAQEHFLAQARTEAVRKLDQGTILARAPQHGAQAAPATGAENVRGKSPLIAQAPAHQQSLQTIDGIAKSLALTPNDPASFGKSFRGTVVGVSEHHTLIKVSDGVGARFENNTLSRELGEGERVSLALDPARELARGAADKGRVHEQGKEPAHKRSGGDVQMEKERDFNPR